MKIKTKLFLTLVGLPTLVLTAFLIIAYMFFQNDKRLSLLDFQNTIAVEYAQVLHQPQGAENLAKAIYTNPSLNFFEVFIVDKQGMIWYSNKRGYQQQNISKILNEKSRKIISERTQGSFEEKDGEHAALVSYASEASGKFLVVVKTPSQLVWRSMMGFIVRIVGTFFIFLSLAVLLSQLFSTSLTERLNNFVSFLDKFDVSNPKSRMPAQGHDEVGVVSRKFNQLADHLFKLIKENEKKAALENEMSVALKVQTSLLPAADFKSDIFTVSGFCQPASHCGGDWWFYQQMDHKLFILVADVTGHGVSSAMITSAVRVAFFYAIEEQRLESSASICRSLNRAIHRTAQGSMQVTFFLAILDLQSGEVEYSNASHEAPFFVAASTRPQMLTEIHGKRLGEDPQSNYTTSKFQMSAGSTLSIFSDGVFNLQSDNKSLNDRRLMKIITEKPGAMEQTDHIRAVTALNKTLEDDVTFVCVQWKGAEA